MQGKQLEMGMGSWEEKHQLGGGEGFFINIYYVSQMVLGSLPALFQSTLEATYIYIPYFIDEKTEAQKNQVP